MNDLLAVMYSLASSGSGSGHVALFCAAIQWVSQCKELLSNQSEQSSDLMEAMCHLLSYISDIVASLKLSSGSMWSGLNSGAGITSPPFEADNLTHLDTDSDWVEDVTQDDDDSAGEDSDEDSMSSKLCTFTLTQKEFMHQHWYHCHTCRMVDGVGVCTVCARVCHRGHDVTYAKYGAFFCDCGAKEDGSCQALVKRCSTYMKMKEVHLVTLQLLVLNLCFPLHFDKDHHHLPKLYRWKNIGMIHISKGKLLQRN